MQRKNSLSSYTSASPSLVRLRSYDISLPLPSDCICMYAFSFLWRNLANTTAQLILSPALPWYQTQLWITATAPRAIEYECSLVLEHLLSMHMPLHLIPGTTKEEKERFRADCGVHNCNPSTLEVHPHIHMNTCVCAQTWYTVANIHCKHVGKSKAFMYH